MHSTKEGRACYEGVEEVHIENMMLKTMYCFDILPNLLPLFVSINPIPVITSLDKGMFPLSSKQHEFCKSAAPICIPIPTTTLT